MKTTKIFEVSLGSDDKAFCAASRYCFPLTGAQSYKNSWLQKCGDLYTNKRKQIFVQVVICENKYWMNAITGTLYKSDGTCMSSTFLILDVLTKNNECLSAA